MKSTPSVLLASCTLLFGANFSNAAEEAPTTCNLSPFSEEIISAGRMLPPEISGNFSKNLNLRGKADFSFRFDIDYFRDIPALTRIILSSALNYGEKTSIPEIAVEKFIANTMRELDTSAKTGGELSFLISAKAAAPCGNRVSVLISRYEDSGGAHGNSVFSCVNFNLAEKKQIFLKDIFKEECISDLEKLLRANDPRREDAGFSYSTVDGEIPLPPCATENFLMLPDGFLFIYSPYELDCYAAGAIRIFVPASELRPLLK